MDDLTTTYSDEIVALMLMESEVIRAADIAPILHMKPEVIIKKAKEGTWDRDICNYVVSGSHVKFFRIDFLKKGGWIQ